MRQVTGKTNLGSAANKVSIQLALDGHSFSIAGRCDTTAERVTAVIVTPRTLLVPEALFAPERAALLLAADGKVPQSGETVVWTEPADGCVAVMAVPEAALTELRRKTGAEASVVYTTPLLEPLHPAQPTVQLQLVDEHLYIKIYHAGLRLAEVVPAASEADVRYAIDRLESDFPAKQYALQVRSESKGRELAKLVGNHYNSIRCE